jgi:hypothetical protein
VYVAVASLLWVVIAPGRSPVASQRTTGGPDIPAKGNIFLRQGSRRSCTLTLPEFARWHWFQSIADVATAGLSSAALWLWASQKKRRGMQRWESGKLEKVGGKNFAQTLQPTDDAF